MSQPFDGHIDDAKIFHRALTPAEIVRLVRPLTRWQRLVAWMRRSWWRVLDTMGGWE